MTSSGAKPELTPLRIVVGSDNAGHNYKEAIKKVLEKHVGVEQVIDVGVHEPSDSTAYPHLAVDACKKIKSGEVSRPVALSPRRAVVPSRNVFEQNHGGVSDKICTG
jgi:hypothetical protein